MTKSKTPGHALKNARVDSGLSQNDLAKKMGYSSPQIVSNWERQLCGLPAKKAALFCKLTGMKPDTMRELLAAESSRKINKKFDLKIGIGKTSKKDIAA